MLAAAALTLAACGDDDGDATATPTLGTGGAVPTETVPATTPAPAETPTTAPSTPAAGGTATGAQTGADAPNPVTIVATDFAFEVQGQLSPGMNELTLQNDGAEPHMVQLVRLTEEKTPAEIEEALQSEAIPEWIELAGGLGDVQPGDSDTVVADLEGGQYLLLCFTAGEDGVPHVAKGMVGMTTAEGETNTASPPESDVEIAAIDYGYESPESIEAGTVSVAFTNEGAEPHEAIVLRLAEGRTVEDIEAVLADPEAPEPDWVEFVGGASGIAPGGAQYLDMEFEAGNYALICFIPNAEGVPHAALGMVKALTVE